MKSCFSNVNELVRIAMTFVRLRHVHNTAKNVSVIRRSECISCDPDKVICTLWVIPLGKTTPFLCWCIAFHDTSFTMNAFHVNTPQGMHCITSHIASCLPKETHSWFAYVSDTLWHQQHAFNLTNQTFCDSLYSKVRAALVLSKQFNSAQGQHPAACFAVVSFSPQFDIWSPGIFLIWCRSFEPDHTAKPDTDTDRDTDRDSDTDTDAEADNKSGTAYSAKTDRKTRCALIFTYGFEISKATICWHCNLLQHPMITPFTHFPAHTHRCHTPTPTRLRQHPVPMPMLLRLTSVFWDLAKGSCRLAACVAQQVIRESARLVIISRLKKISVGHNATNSPNALR